MVGGAEDHSLVALTISLKPFKNRLPVMERGIGRINRNFLVRNNAGVVPTLRGVVIHDEHIIRKVRAESDFRNVGLGFEIFSFDKFNFCHKTSS